ncbi:transmembrane protein, putative [Actinidia rufa]|uniref:Transmembrane protein, putative n=1 Tax=Actinidia rufa TaxID=165716 RepID=A0A7J0GD60_9ERIC|nr:transmembrane protein, putative [Actinidia rufa]
MGSNSGGGGEEKSHHIIQIWKVKKERLEILQQKISATPRLLSKSAGHSNCCIFRVPQSLIDVNGRAYQPHIVSIGPFHHGEPRVQMIEEHKWRFLGGLLNRTRDKGLGLEDYLQAIQPLEARARECYSETIHLDTDEFVEMLVLDGCFIIELFRKMGKLVQFEPDDPLISMSWVYSFFLRDFIRLENQIPFFVLQHLFDISVMPGEESRPSLAELALEFFNNAMQRPDEVIGKYTNTQGRHLLDFLRSSFIPLEQDPCKQGNSPPTRVIQCISKLRRAGISLRPSKEDSFLVVKFHGGVIEMPTIAIDDFMSCFMINCVALEQCQKNCSKHFTTYATFLDCLVNTSRDVEFLSDKNIIENYFGTDAEVAKLINDLGKDVTFDIEKCYLANLFTEVNEYYKNGWHVQWASFRFTYFNSPWSFVSALAAFILLVLSVAQTYYTMLGYIQPPE